MKTQLPALLAALLLPPAPAIQAATVSKALLDSAGSPMVGVTIRAIQLLPTPRSVETITDPEGGFSLDLSDGDWTIEADPADILNRGYFCAPGIGIGIDGETIIVGFTGWISFVAIPLRPKITQLIRNSQVILQLDFDWRGGLQPFILRSYRIERSTDLQTWQPLATILLSNPPIYVVDPAGQTTGGSVHYRAVQTPSFSTSLAPTTFTPITP